VSVCTDTALSLHDLEAYGRVWGTGRERRALCPFCGDEHRRDQEHASLAVNVETGVWTCHRCNRSGLLDEFKTPRDDDPLRSGRRCRSPRPTPPREPSPAELAEQAEKRTTLKRLWASTVPIVSPAAAAGADYLWSRGIPLPFALEARVRFGCDWYGRAAVVFPMQDAAGHLVAAESRYVDAGAPKSRSAGRKAAGVFVASPGALEADRVIVVEGPITALSIAACGLPAIALCGHVLHERLARCLAGRTVFVALDWDEDGAERQGDAAFRALAGVGARPYRLALPAGAGDFNDYLRAVGLTTMRSQLDEALRGVKR
jgi:phage/plasmid primase-like uncharacterized protein